MNIKRAATAARGGGAVVVAMFVGMMLCCWDVKVKEWMNVLQGSGDGDGRPKEVTLSCGQVLPNRDTAPHFPTAAGQLCNEDTQELQAALEILRIARMKAAFVESGQL